MASGSTIDRLDSGTAQLSAKADVPAASETDKGASSSMQKGLMCRKSQIA
jgi:hypothetical protein